MIKVLWMETERVSGTPRFFRFRERGIITPSINDFIRQAQLSTDLIPPNSRIVEIGYKKRMGISPYWDFEDRNHFVNYCIKIIKNKFGKKRANDFNGLKSLLHSLYQLGISDRQNYSNLYLHNPIAFCAYHFKKCSKESTFIDLINALHFYLNNYKNGVQAYAGDEGHFGVFRKDVLEPIGLSHTPREYWTYYNAKKARLTTESRDCLKGKQGLYKLYDVNRNLIYIGKSKRLEDRVPNQINKYKADAFSIVEIENEADLSILETYLISKENPRFNREFKTKDIPSCELKVPKESQVFELYQE